MVQNIGADLEWGWKIMFVPIFHSSEARIDDAISSFK